jgi:predicted DNA-binding transcriptional regulator AlpA
VVGKQRADEREEAVETQRPIERLLDVAEVAEILGCSRAQVYAGVKEGWLKPVPLPYRTTRFTRDEIERLLRGDVA